MSISFVEKCLYHAKILLINPTYSYTFFHLPSTESYGASVFALLSMPLSPSLSCLPTSSSPEKRIPGNNANNRFVISPHFKSQFESVKSLVDISKLDSARTLQQSICYHRGPGAPWSVSVSWGLTVEIYPWFVPPKDLVKALITFRSWRTDQGSGPFTFDTRRRSNWPCDWPLRFSFRNAMFETGKDGNNSTVTEYLTDSNPTDKKCDSLFFVEAWKVKMVRVIAPKMHLSEWKMAPRSQCCETERINEREMLMVRINQCQPAKNSLGL